MNHEPGHHIDGVVQAAIHQGEDQFDRDLRGDFDSPHSYRVIASELTDEKDDA